MLEPSQLNDELIHWTWLCPSSPPCMLHVFNVNANPRARSRAGLGRRLATAWMNLKVKWWTQSGSMRWQQDLRILICPEKWPTGQKILSKIVRGNLSYCCISSSLAQKAEQNGEVGGDWGCVPVHWLVSLLFLRSEVCWIILEWCCCFVSVLWEPLQVLSECSINITQILSNIKALMQSFSVCIYHTTQ